MAVPTVVTAATAESPAKEFVPAALPVAAPEKKSAPDEAAMTERRRASEDIVANALALGRWSDADADALVFASQTLPIEEQHALQLRVARAINEDRLKFAE
jgi:hypothetical protein